MSDLWIGLLLSIPVGIGVNLLSGPAQRFVGHLSQRVERRRVARDRTLTEFASALAQDPARSQLFAFETLIRIAFFGAVFGSFSGVLWVLNYFVNGPIWISNYWVNVDYLVGVTAQCVALFGTIIVMNIAGTGIQTLRRAREVREDSHVREN